MERRNTQKNNPYHSTSDLLSWSEIRIPDSSSAANHPHQPSDGISEIFDGCKITNEETESLNKNVSYRKNCSGHKLKEMTGSDIFSDNGKDEPNHKSINHYHQDQNSYIFSDNGKDEPNHMTINHYHQDQNSQIFSDNGKDEPNHMTINHYHQDQNSQISFSGEEIPSPKKPTTLTEAGKKKELSRTVHTAADSKSKKKQIPNAKTKAISGHNTLASPLPLESQPRHLLAATKQEVEGIRNMEESAPASIKASNVRSSFKAVSNY